MHIGYQIPNFTYPGVEDAKIFDTIVAQAKEADAAGFDRISVMDHFYQLPMLGAPQEPMLECYTLLAALAQHTSRARLTSMVTGNTYRNPTLLAKEITALDHVSAGRATLAIGAGWFELEHTSLGFEFDTFTERFEKLEEALQIIIPMLRGEQVSFDGKHYKVEDAFNHPAPISRVPIMIGGAGEKKTLRMVAQYADESNLAGTQPHEIPRKLEVLEEHCERLGRDRSEIMTTVLVFCHIAPTVAEAEADLKEMAEVKGWNDEVLQMVRGMVAFGDSDTLLERLSAYADAGIDGFTLSLPSNGHKPGRVSLVAETAKEFAASR